MAMAVEFTGNFEKVTRPLRAAAVAAGTDMARPIITAVAIRVHDEVKIQATDSYRLIDTAFSDEVEFVGAGEPSYGDFLLPAKELVGAIVAAEKAVGGKARARSAQAKLKVSTVDYTWTLTAGDFSMSGRLLDGTYPDTATLFPEKTIQVDGVVAWNPGFLAGLEAVRKALGADTTVPAKLVAATSHKPAWWEIQNHGYAVVNYLLMPVRVP